MMRREFLNDHSIRNSPQGSALPQRAYSRTPHQSRRIHRSSGAFLILIAYAVCWLLFQPDTLNWHAVATLATWCMTLFIQR